MTLRVLLVEDNAELRREICEYLCRRSLTVTAVGSVTEARSVLDRSPSSNDALDVVLCDLNLQDGNGAELYGEFASVHPSCRWILMSGAPDPDALRSARQPAAGLPPCTIVAKPISLRGLAALVSAGSSP
jgi:DNA-binding NtrC family response regulator